MHTFSLFFCALEVLPLLSHWSALVSNLAAFCSAALAIMMFPFCSLVGLCVILPIMEVMLPLRAEGG
jgi:hypothetical protein